MIVLITQEGQSNVKLWLENVLNNEDILDSILVSEEKDDKTKCKINLRND